MRRLFEQEVLSTRIAQFGSWSPASRILEFGFSSGGLLLSRTLNCHLTVADPDAAGLEASRALARERGAEDVTFESATFEEIVARDGDKFDGVMCFNRVLGGPARLSAKIRNLLKPNGLAAYSIAVKVNIGKKGTPAAFWQAAVGESPLAPSEALGAMVRTGFEPELLEMPDYSELASFYERLRKHLPPEAGDRQTDAVRAELASFRSTETPKAMPAFVVLRRSEPGDALRMG